MKSCRTFALSILYPLLPILCLTGCRTYAPPTPLAQLNAQQSRGHHIFQAHCAQCHQDRVDASLHGPALISVFKKPYLHSGAPANDDRVTYTILHGHNLMPAQPDLDPAQSPGDLDDLLSYLHTL